VIYFGTLRSLLQRKLSRQLPIMPERAGEDGCLRYLGEREQPIAEMVHTSFGDRIISLKSCLVRDSQGKS